MTRGQWEALAVNLLVVQTGARLGVADDLDTSEVTAEIDRCSSVFLFNRFAHEMWEIRSDQRITAFQGLRMGVPVHQRRQDLAVAFGELHRPQLLVEEIRRAMRRAYLQSLKTR